MQKVIVDSSQEIIPVTNYFPSVFHPYLYLFYIYLQWYEFSETPFLICFLICFLFDRLVFFPAFKVTIWMTEELFIQRVY